MDMNYEIVGCSLKTNEFIINFNYEIADVHFYDGIFVVLLTIPTKVNEIDNIYGVDLKGNVAWRIENPIKAFDIENDEQGYNYFASSTYISISMNKGIFIGTTFFSMKYTFDYKTGELLKKEAGRW